MVYLKIMGKILHFNEPEKDCSSKYFLSFHHFMKGLYQFPGSNWLKGK